MEAPRAVRVLYVQYTNPAHYPPLVHGAELLRREGSHVAFLGIGWPDDPQQIETGPQTECRLRRPGSGAWQRPLHYAAFTAWVLWHACRYRPDWLYASDALAAVPAWLVSRLLRVNVVYHEHDAPSDATLGRSGFWRVVLGARSAAAGRATVRVAPSEARARLLATATAGEKVEVVWNCPLLSQVAAPRPAESGLRVVYHGTIVPSRVPLAVVEALALTPEDVTLTVIGYETVGHPGHVAALEARAQRLGVRHRLVCRPAVSREALMVGCADFDAGLSLLPTASTDVNEQSMIGASNKPFDYMACGLALVVPDRPEWRATFVDAGYGVACRAEDAADVARAFAALRDRPDRRFEMGRRAQERIRTEWNYDTQFRPIVERLLAGRAAPDHVQEPDRV